MTDKSALDQLANQQTALKNTVNSHNPENLDPVYGIMLQQLRYLAALSDRHDNPDVVSELSEQMLEIAQFLVKTGRDKKC